MLETGEKGFRDTSQQMISVKVSEVDKWSSKWWSNCLWRACIVVTRIERKRE